MNPEEITKELKVKAEKFVNLTPQEIDEISADEIQRLFYDLQVHQIELKMQNDELQISQQELATSRNRYHFLFHQIPVGIVTVNHLGFITGTNQYFCHMLKIESNRLIKKHLTTLIVEEDKNQFINRFDAFFKRPENKSLNLRLKGNQKTPFFAKLSGKLDKSEDAFSPAELDDIKLVIAVTNVDDISGINQ